MRILTVLTLFGVILSAPGLLAADENAAAKDEVLDTLRSMAAAIIEKDATTLDRLYHEDLTYNHSTGMKQDKAQVMRAVASGSFVTMRFSDPTILIYDSVAVVQTTTDLQYRPGGVLVDRHLNQLYVLVKGEQGWKVVARHTTRIQP
jgi:ketosteroid isomerase-like protein